MQLKNFLSSQFIAQPPSVVCFLGTEYPLLFFASFIAHVKKNRFSMVEFIDLAEQDFGSVVARCESSFLGMSALYWLGSLEELDAKKKAYYIDFLNSYQGPHSLWVYADQGDEKSFTLQTYPIPEHVDKKWVQNMAHFFYGEQSYKRMSPFIQALGSQLDTLSCEQAYTLLRYGALVGSDYHRFINEWMHHIIPTEESLFTLSQHFFAKNTKKFWMLWKKIHSNYSEQFWMAFWSEQLFRSYHVIRLMKAQRFADAKSIAFRLPFSLIQQDWKKNDLQELLAAHQFLYSLDHGLKNGSGTHGLDLLFSTFFIGGFGQEQPLLS